jgi:hypothetical protein
MLCVLTICIMVLSVLIERLLTEHETTRVLMEDDSSTA